ncbi:MAG: hypothetical protein HYV97_18725 [Bdellovibrio sp.]|nr:hypothetical protein [Bdellovibrio sp.]
MLHDFKSTPFSGTLLELLELCWEHMPDDAVCRDAHHWVEEQPKIAGNLLPVRKFSPAHSSRGQICVCGSLRFIPTDNEPLAGLYKLWTQGQVPSEPIGVMLRKRIIPASWNCDVISNDGLRFSGVSSPFRDHGLKLAHISDAALGIQGQVDGQSITVRFLRSLSPLNVFLFPSHRQVVCSVVKASDGRMPTRRDWAEDALIRGVAFGWLLDKLSYSSATNFFSKWADLAPDLNWKQVAAGTIVTVKPKSGVPMGVSSDGTPNKKMATGTNTKPLYSTACPQYSNGEALSFDEAIDVLRKWRMGCPASVQLDGKSENNPKRWFHFKVEGYSSPQDDFQSRYGVQFTGSDYNGIVNFHGDTKSDKIDEFIRYVDAADDYRDVLRPSATYEFTTKPQDKPTSAIKPKFSLKGYNEGVDGFFLYHDHWKTRR